MSDGLRKEIFMPSLKPISYPDTEKSKGATLAQKGELLPITNPATIREPYGSKHYLNPLHWKGSKCPYGLLNCLKSSLSLCVEAMFPHAQEDVSKHYLNPLHWKGSKCPYGSLNCLKSSLSLCVEAMFPHAQEDVSVV